jgi:anti-anti-sigma factor
MKLTIARVGEASIFRIGGKVGWESSRRLDHEVRDALAAGTRFLVFELDAVQFLSSGAIGVLVYHLRQLQGVSGDIFVVASNNYVLYLFQTIGFHRVFEGKIFRDMDDLGLRMAPLDPGWDVPPDNSWREVEDVDRDDDERSQREEER